MGGVYNFKVVKLLQKMVEADSKPPQTIEDPPPAQTNTIEDPEPKPEEVKKPNTALAGAMMLMGGAKKKEEAAKPAG